MKIADHPSGTEQVSEMLILSNGQIFVHNLTPAMARLLVELDPADAAMLRRAAQIVPAALSAPPTLL